jgi:hypothetical protein
MKRREVMTAFGWSALLARPVLHPAALGSTVSLIGASNLMATAADATVFDLSSAPSNVLAMAKLTATLEVGAYKHGWYSGVLMGVIPGQSVRELVGIIGMSSQRLRPVPEQQGYQLLQKECGFFVDLASGDVLDRWFNPYLEEWVEPFHIANPAVNRWILPVLKEERFYDRVDGKAPEGRPFVLPWQRSGDRVFLEQRSHFWAKNPLDPAVWRRESTGESIQVSDMMSYNASWSDLADPSVPSVDYSGHWVHVRPWQPWMLMGTHPGHCLYSAMTGSARSTDDIPPNILRVVQARLPDFLVPPSEVLKSEPSMVRFMRERKPS